MNDETRLTEADVATVFNALADEHSKKLEVAEGRRTLQRIQRAANSSRMQLPARRVAILTLVPAIGAAALTFGLTSWLTPGPLSFEVEGAVLQDGLVEAGAKAAVLNFSDESRVVAHPNSVVSMSLVGEHGALARLREGALRVKVEHAEKTDWRFLAGPYEVRVVGTEFELNWQPEAEQLSVVMHEGRVRVVGPEKSETILSAGDSHTFGPASEADTVVRSAAVEALEAAVARTEQPGAERLPPPNQAGVKANVAKPINWAKLVGKGQFADVVRDAETVGLEAALASRSSQDLQALAQAAHYTGRTSLALKTWAKVRQRFGSQRSGKQAAFFMGRIYDQQGSGQNALRWLNTYLAEAGADVYASEALGRKLTLVQRLQGQAPAERVAQEYLRRFPKGAYARTAQALLGD